MLTLLRRLIDSIRCQRGQVLVIAVGVMALSLGAIMISVDVGWWLRDKRDAQNDADAIALAAVQELPDTTAAVDAGRIWANNNGINPDTEMAPPDCADGDIQGNFCFIDLNSDGADDKVRVKVSRLSNSFIAGALGVGTPTLSPPAAASKLNAVASCIMPWGIIAGDPPDPEFHYNLDPNQMHIFQNSDANTPGNYGAISIYGTGQDVYKAVIRNTCEPVKFNACSDQLVEEGDTLEECKSNPGVGGHTTYDALEDRYANMPELSSACDANTSQEAAALSKTGECDGRAVPLAIIDAFPPGGSRADISIYGIAIFYIAGWDRAAPWGTGDPDGIPSSGFVWGFLLTDIPVTPAWEIEWDVSDNPFAPVGFFLVE